MRLSSVSLGINTASANKGEKFVGNPINLLATNSANKNATFFHIKFPWFLVPCLQS